MTTIRTTFAFLALSALASCTQHFHYAPNTMHFPTTKQQGEASVEASLTGSRQARGSEVKASYCIAPKTSVMANFMYLRGSFQRNLSFATPTSPPPEEHSGYGYFGELGITRHFPVSQYTDFTVTGGAGIGKAINDYDRNRFSNLNIYRAFVQPALVTKGEMANVGIGLRYSYLNFGGTVDYALDEADLNQVLKIDQKGYFLIPDLGFSTGINFSRLQVNCNILLSLHNLSREYAMSNHALSVALKYDLDYWTDKGRPKKKKKK